MPTAVAGRPLRPRGRVAPTPGQIWRKGHRDPRLALHAAELKWLDAVAGKRIAVLGGGDNEVVFTLAGLGARVTSVDQILCAIGGAGIGRTRS